MMNSWCTSHQGNYLASIKNDLDQRTSDVYSIPCKRGTLYIGQTRHSIQTGLKEHHWNIHFFCPIKSTVVAYSSQLKNTLCPNIQMHALDYYGRDRIKLPTA
jgi:hypothetical protein